MDFRKVLVIPLCGASLLGVAFVAAQEKPRQPTQPQAAQGQQQGRPAQAGERSQGQNADQMLASCVAIDSAEEVALTKFAHDKLQHEDVKAFAKKMMEEHQACLMKLQKFAPEATREGYLMEKSRTARAETTATPSTKSGVEQAKATNNAGQPGIQQTSDTQQARTGQPVDALQLHKEIAQECLSWSKQELGKKTGAEMDQCFIGFQIAKHAAMKTKLTVFERHASAELAPHFAQAAEACGEHMKEAEAIMKKLDTSESKPRREERRDNKN